MTLANRTILVTGADGFIGSHLVEELVRIGAQVRAFCLYNSSGSWGWLDGVSPDVKDALDVRLGDIRDARFVEEVCHGVDTVYHLAALIAIPYSYIAPESFVDTNIKGTLNVLEAVRRSGCRRLVQISTSEVYGTPGTLPITEDHPLQAQSPYSASKIAADKLCEAYFCAFGVPVVTLRPFNTYGPRQSARAVIPTILGQLLGGRRVIRLGNLEPRRDLTYVSDTVAGMVAAGDAAAVEGVTIQLGTGRSFSIRAVFELACKCLGVSADVEVASDRARPERSEVMVLESDASKAQALLGWKAAVPLDDGIQRVASWLQQQGPNDRWLNHQI